LRECCFNVKFAGLQDKGEKMTQRTDAAGNRFHLPAIFTLLIAVLTGMACTQAANSPVNARSTPANASVGVKPTETEIKQAAPATAGKEIKPADGPALKSITPPEGTILGGVLNDIAASLPTPDPAAAKAANASGKVTVEVMVNEKGEIAASSVVSGPQPLWSAAGAAARQARFDPPLKDGKPVKVAGVLIYEFPK
jgi:TonB family protein